MNIANHWQTTKNNFNFYRKLLKNVAQITLIAIRNKMPLPTMHVDAMQKIRDLGF